MLVARTSLLIPAAAVMFVTATYSAAEAGFLCKRGMGGMGGFQRSFSFAPPAKISTPTYTTQAAAKPPVQKRAAKKAPPQQNVVATSAKPASVASAKPPVPAKPAVVATPAVVAKPAVVATPAVVAKPAAVTEVAGSAPVATPVDTCLTKEYLENGTVRFKDVCTKEWAINSTDRDGKASNVDRNCLTKQSSQGGVLMFKDICTGEWAMNTTKQMALANSQ